MVIMIQAEHNLWHLWLTGGKDKLRRFLVKRTLPDPISRAQVFCCVNQYDFTKVRAAILTYTKNLGLGDTKYIVYSFYWQAHVYRL